MKVFMLKYLGTILMIYYFKMSIRKRTPKKAQKCVKHICCELPLTYTEQPRHYDNVQHKMIYGMGCGTPYLYGPLAYRPDDVNQTLIREEEDFHIQFPFEYFPTGDGVQSIVAPEGERTITDPTVQYQLSVGLANSAGSGLNNVNKAQYPLSVIAVLFLHQNGFDAPSLVRNIIFRNYQYDYVCNDANSNLNVPVTYHNVGSVELNPINNPSFICDVQPVMLSSVWKDSAYGVSQINQSVNTLSFKGNIRLSQYDRLAVMFIVPSSYVCPIYANQLYICHFNGTISYKISYN